MNAAAAVLIAEPALSSPVSERKRVANRENASHSTGPKTGEGKLASSRNALRHGLTGGFALLPDEDAAEFERMQLALIDEHQPSTETESQLVVDMARHYWLYQRALRLQDECFFDDLNLPAVQKRLALFLRYGTGHERQYSRCLHDLLKLRKDKLRLERGFESQVREQAAEVRRSAAEIRREKQDLRLDAAEKRREEAFRLNVNAAASR